MRCGKISTFTWKKYIQKGEEKKFTKNKERWKTSYTHKNEHEIEIDNIFT